MVCVSDDSVNEIINLLPVDQHVAYTSGSVSLKSLDRKQKNGVIYPLQTFSAHVPVDFYNIPIFIEGSDEYFAQTLFDFAWKHSRQVVFADSELRLKLHLAAVMVNNFVNHIHSLAEDFLTNNQVEYHFLHSLIEETARKATKYSPNQSQTGPAKRNDKKTIYKHLSMLSENEKNIYKELTNSILKKYNHEEL